MTFCEIKGERNNQRLFYIIHLKLFVQISKLYSLVESFAFILDYTHFKKKNKKKRKPKRSSIEHFWFTAFENSSSFVGNDKSAIQRSSRYVEKV